MYDLEGRLRQKDTRQAGALPYEFRALEAILISVTSGLEGEFEGVREPVVRVLRELEEDIDRYKLRYLLIYSKKLGTFEQKARLVRNAIDDLLEADDDLASMYLTEKAAGKTRSENDHTEVEMLLESYHKVTDEIVQASENLVSNIRNTEEMYVYPFMSARPDCHKTSAFITYIYIYMMINLPVTPLTQDMNHTESKPSSMPIATRSCCSTSNSALAPSVSAQVPSSPRCTA